MYVQSSTAGYVHRTSYITYIYIYIYICVCVHTMYDVHNIHLYELEWAGRGGRTSFSMAERERATLVSSVV